MIGLQAPHKTARAKKESVEVAIRSRSSRRPLAQCPSSPEAQSLCLKLAWGQEQCGKSVAEAGGQGKSAVMAFAVDSPRSRA